MMNRAIKVRIENHERFENLSLVVWKKDLLEFSELMMCCPIKTVANVSEM